MKDSIYERVAAWLNSTEMPLRQIAREADVPLSTVKRIRAQVTPDPRIGTLENLDRLRHSVEQRIT